MKAVRAMQATCLAVFLGLVWLEPGFLGGGAARLFMRLDPLMAPTVALVEAKLVAVMMPALVVLGLTAVFGRFFCSAVCPLGTTIDITDRCVPERVRPALPGPSIGKHLTRVKYVVLAVTVLGSILGVSLSPYVSPLSIATRLYGVVIPIGAAAAASWIMEPLRTLAGLVGWNTLEYASVSPRSYGPLWPAVLITVAVLSGCVITPRFWCRFLCPAGALLSLVSLRPLLTRRRVSASCTGCGACTQSCPMGAVGFDPRATKHAECIACMRCQGSCPEAAISFTDIPDEAIARTAGRRAFVLGTLAWAAGLTAAVTAAAAAFRNAKAFTAYTTLVRPPGSLPEEDFIRLCTGCGACVAVCPTNALQGAGLASGVRGIFSPVLAPAVGFCEKECNACTRACPTGAIRYVALHDKPYAKVGTATIDKNACIAWSRGLSCLVCDEVCPYGAVDLVARQGFAVMVPEVDAGVCTGCGCCEHHCPVKPVSAIVVTPSGAVRLRTGPFPRPKREKDLTGQKGTFTGRSPEGPRFLPPGFSD